MIYLQMPETHYTSILTRISILFLFFLPPYSPHLNIAETLWRILKGKWLRPVDYTSTDSLMYATNGALAGLGSELYINFAHAA